jgi:hypothetical protein
MGRSLAGQPRPSWPRHPNSYVVLHGELVGLLAQRPVALALNQPEGSQRSDERDEADRKDWPRAKTAE